MSDFDPGQTALAEFDRNLVGVDLVMMLGTQQYQVVQTRWPALTPMLDVMSLRPPCRSVAERKDTSAVADHERGAYLFRNYPGATPNVERFASW